MIKLKRCFSSYVFPHRLCAFWCCVFAVLHLTTAEEAEKPVSDDEDDDDFTCDSRTVSKEMPQHLHVSLIVIREKCLSD